MCILTIMTTDETKITLSAKELELVCNAEWILTKQIIIGKVAMLLSRALETMQAHAIQQKTNLPDTVFLRDPKISKGENYKGLPYVILDYPRFFGKDDTLAMRTFFWWGNFFSVNLQLSGKYKTLAAPKLRDSFSWLQQQEYWLCINSHPWEHAFTPDNFLPFKQIAYEDFVVMLQQAAFIKIGKKQSIQHWDTALPFIRQSFEALLKLLENQAPKR